MKNKVKSLGRRFISHELITGSFFVFLGSMTNNVFSFLFNLFLVRTFSTSDYGIYASLLSLITLSSFLSQSFVTIIVKFAADYFAENKINEAALLYKKLFRYIFILSCILFFFFLILLPSVKNFLHINSSSYILIAGTITFISYLAIVNEAFLRSILKFKYLSFLASFGSFLKLAWGFALVTLGFGIYGALNAILLNSIVPFALAFLPLIFLWKEKTHEQTLPFKQMASYAIPASITVLALTSFVTTDIILVKHFFSSSLAGLYGGLSLIGKVIFYFTFPIPFVMFPLIIKRYNAKLQFHRLFYFSLLLVLIPSVSITLVYFIFPQFMVSLFLGGRNYTEIASLVGFFGIFISIYSLANVCVNFFLSIGKAGIYKLVFPVSMLQILLIYLFHHNFLQIIFASIFSSILLLIILLLYYYQEFYGLYHSKE